MDNLGIYFINLENRTDKENSAVNQLSQTGIPFERVKAVTDEEIDASAISYRYFRLVSAVKKSHMKACSSFLESNYEIALILEDDFILDPINLASDLEKCINSMQKRGIHFLQVGFLGYDQIVAQSFFERIMRTILERIYNTYHDLLYPRTNLVMGSIRWGAQAYLIDRRGASGLVKLIDVGSKDAIDTELRKLVKVSKSDLSFISVGRVKKNLIRQNLFFDSDTQGIV
jgi:GR25 family glycosyltransferase involved in LPS biosynthesis